VPTHPTARAASYVLWFLFGVLWIWLAIFPHDRADWALENALVLSLGVIRLVAGERLALSPRSSMLLCVFLMLHSVGAHYTYSKVPYDAWYASLTSQTLSELLGWERNHYDRLVHFAAGALLVLPIRELWLKRRHPDVAAAGVIALLFVMAGSLAYELIEWAAASVLGGELGAAYLGTQGDEWDAQKDMALATLGGVLTLGVFRLVRSIAPNAE
jgi:putative membrane protein